MVENELRVVTIVGDAAVRGCREALSVRFKAFLGLGS